MGVNKPPRPVTSPCLFVRRAKEDEVTLEWHPCAFEQGQRHELRGGYSFTVDRPAAIHIPLLERAGERIDLPVGFHGRHHVEMVQEDKGFFLAAAFQAGVYHPTSRLRLEHLRLQALLGQVLLPEGSGRDFVARRICRVDLQIAAE